MSYDPRTGLPYGQPQRPQHRPEPPASNGFQIAVLVLLVINTVLLVFVGFVALELQHWINEVKGLF